MGIFQRLRGGVGAGRGDAPYPQPQTQLSGAGRPPQPPARTMLAGGPPQPPRPRRDTWNIREYWGSESTPLQDLNEAVYKISPSPVTRHGAFKPQASGSQVGGYTKYDSFEDTAIQKGLTQHTRGLQDAERILRYSTDPRARKQSQDMAQYHRVQIEQHKARAKEMGALKESGSQPPRPPQRP